MDRRTFVCSVAGGLLAAPLGAGAQQSRRGRVARIGILSQFRTGAATEELALALQQFGYGDGRSAVIEWRWADDKNEQFADLASELVRLKVDVIIAMGSEATEAAKQATSTIPIVFAAGNAVETGFVRSLARPGGNLTGITNQLSDLATKYLQLLRDVLPEVFGVAVLWSQTNASMARFLHDAEIAAPQFRFKIQGFAIASADEVDAAFAAIERFGPRAMIVLGPTLVFENDSRISEFALKNRIATLSGTRRMVERGLLMFYGPTSAEGAMQMANYVDKILKGAKPADLPVQQPTKFEFVVNLKTAKALGLAIPQSLLVRADEVIQ
jgi:putative ABC transport system substrate-binding protein